MIKIKFLIDVVKFLYNNNNEFIKKSTIVAISDNRTVIAQPPL